jgi:surfeit locus 1 family protein
VSPSSGLYLKPLFGSEKTIKSNNGFYRQWRPFYGSVDKHLGYALQWFLMALVLSFINLMRSLGLINFT